MGGDEADEAGLAVGTVLRLGSLFCSNDLAPRLARSGWAEETADPRWSYSNVPSPVECNMSTGRMGNSYLRTDRPRLWFGIRPSGGICRVNPDAEDGGIPWGQLRLVAE